MKSLICIVCPKGCHLTVDENNGYKVTGNGCTKGDEYAVSEMTDPHRTVTSTVFIKGAAIERLPVKTSKPIPKNKIVECMKIINSITATSPVKIGDVLVKNIFNTDSDIVACRNL